MAMLYRLDHVREATEATFFDRNELNQLLSLYSRRVSRGEWRDYAIDRRAGRAVFSVFRHSHDAPVYRISKIARRTGSPDRRNEYVVSSGGETLKSAKTMSDALTIFAPDLRTVS